jgi:hypothetical protein
VTSKQEQVPYPFYPGRVSRRGVVRLRPVGDTVIDLGEPFVSPVKHPLLLKWLESHGLDASDIYAMDTISFTEDSKVLAVVVYRYKKPFRRAWHRRGVARRLPKVIWL